MGVKQDNDVDPNLRPEFARHEKPYGLEQHQQDRIWCGAVAHIGAFYFLFYLLPFGYVPKSTMWLAFLYGLSGGMGITVGCHRLWTHKTFKAKLPLQIILMLMQSIAFQYPIYKWCRDHRVHHKYTDTNADPHNSKRGFWFCHCGWLWEPKHPDVVEKLKSIDMEDLANDPVVRFQSKYYRSLVLVMNLIVPMTLCHWFFPQMSFSQIFAWNMAWYTLLLHVTFCVNSLAHLWGGDKPYDKYISARDNRFVAFVAAGEGWHNYHHTFPWDYKTSEFGWKLNLSTMFIDFFALVGWAYDLKTVSPKVFEARIKRTGDSSHVANISDKEKANDKDDIFLQSKTCWGLDDPELNKNVLEFTETLYPVENRRG